MDKTYTVFFPFTSTYKQRNDWCLARGIIRWEKPAGSIAIRGKFEYATGCCDGNDAIACDVVVH